MVKSCIAIFLILINSTFFFQGHILKGYQEPKKIDYPPQVYETPQSLEEAKKIWDQSETRAQEAQKEYNNALEEKQKLMAAKKEYISAGKQAIYNELLDGAINYEKSTETVLNSWKNYQDILSENRYVKYYKEQLARSYNPSLQRDQWESFKNWLSRGLKNFQLILNNFIRNKEAANGARQELIQLYSDMGPDGLLKKAQMQRELAKEVDTWQLKIKHHIDALDSYSKASSKNIIDKASVGNEVKLILIDLMQVLKSLDSQYDSGGNKIALQEYRKMIQEDILKVVRLLGISDAEYIGMELQAQILPSPLALSTITQEDIVKNEEIKKFIETQNKDNWSAYQDAGNTDKQLQNKFAASGNIINQ